MSVSWLRPLTTEVRVRSQLSPCEICGGQSASGTGFSPSTFVSPVSIILPTLHTHFIYTLLLPEGQTGDAWKSSKKKCTFVNRKCTVTILEQLQDYDRQLSVIIRLFPSCAYFCINSRTPLPRGVYYNLNIPNCGHTPCRTTPISLVNYVIKRPPLSVTHTDHKSII